MLETDVWEVAKLTMTRRNAERIVENEAEEPGPRCWREHRHSRPKSLTDSNGRRARLKPGEESSVNDRG